jgi:cellulose synthase operon protein C
VAPLYRYALLSLLLAGFAISVPVSYACAQVASPTSTDWGEDQYAIAAQHYRQQRWQSAIGQFRLLLEREPNHARATMAMFFLGESHVQLEQYDECLEHFHSFLAQEKKHSLTTRAKFRLGEAYYLLGRDDESIRELTALLAADQERQFTEFTLAYLGEMLLKQASATSLQLARDYLQRVVNDYPDSSLLARSQLGLAQAFQKQGEMETAESLLKSLQTSSDPSIAEEATLILAALWIERGQAEQVRKALTDDMISQLSATQQPKARYWRGRAEMAVKNWSQAGELILASAPQLDDTRLQQAAWYDAAICFWQAGDLVQAQQLLRQSIENFPTGDWAAESLFLLLQAAARDPQSAEATEYAETFLTRFPDHSLANKVRETLGRQALNRRDHAQSEVQFQSLLSKPVSTPDNSLERANWYYLLALSQIGLDNLEQGLESLSACLKLLPSVPSREPTESLDAWLRQHPPASTEVAVRSVEEQLREQALFAQASVFVRQKQWASALASQAEILWANPDTRFRYELLADRLRSHIALQDWAGWTIVAETAKTWLNLPEDMETTAVRRERTASENLLMKSLTATALTAAEYWYDRRDYAQAIGWFHVAALAPDEVIVEQALSGLAWAEFQTRPAGESEATARLLMDRFTNSPRSAEIGLKLVEQQFRDGRDAAADELLRTLLNRFPTWSRRHQLLALQAKLLARRSEPSAKIEAMEAWKAAIVSLESAAIATPELQTQKSMAAAAYLYDLAWLQHDLGQVSLATQAFERIHLNHPTSRYWADATFRLAQAHFAEGRLSSATDLAQQLLQSGSADPLAKEPPSTDPRPTAGVPTLSASFRNPGATSEPDHDSVPAVTPLVSTELKCHALYLRTMIGVTEKDWSSVETWSQQLVSEFPNHRLRWMSQFWLGEAKFRQLKFGEAIEQLSEIVPRTDEQADPWVAMTHLRLAQSLGHLDRWTDVLSIAEPARRRFTDFSQAYELDYLIGRALATEARFPQARAAYQQVIDSPTGKQTETAAMAQWMIGETYFHQEQFALASDAYHRTETLYRFPQWQAAALLQAGKCYEHLGRPQDAIGVYRQLLNEHPNCTLVKQAEARLATLKPDRSPKLVPANPLPSNRLPSNRLRGT